MGRMLEIASFFYTFDTAFFMGDDEACQLKALVMAVRLEREAYFFSFLLYINLRGYSEWTEDDMIFI